MGSGSRQKKNSSFSIFNLFKFRRSQKVDRTDNFDDEINSRKVRPCDDDRGPWKAVPDPRINTKASAFIANFHAARISDSESQIYQAAGKA